MVPVNTLCSRHLAGEHGEIHKHRHNFVKQHSIAGRRGQIEPRAMKARHDELEAELQRRAIAAGRRPPCSPYEMPDISYLPDEDREGRVDIEAAWRDLRARCPECDRLYKEQNETNLGIR